MKSTRVEILNFVASLIVSMVFCLLLTSGQDKPLHKSGTLTRHDVVCEISATNSAAISSDTYQVSFSNIVLPALIDKSNIPFSQTYNSCLSDNKTANQRFLFLHTNQLQIKPLKFCGFLPCMLIYQKADDLPVLS